MISCQLLIWKSTSHSKTESDGTSAHRYCRETSQKYESVFFLWEILDGFDPVFSQCLPLFTLGISKIRGSITNNAVNIGGLDRFAPRLSHSRISSNCNAYFRSFRVILSTERFETHLLDALWMHRSFVSVRKSYRNPGGRRGSVLRWDCLIPAFQANTTIRFEVSAVFWVQSASKNDF